MLKMIKTAVLSAVIGLGGIAAIPATAQADGLYINFGGNGPGYATSVQYHGHDRHHGWRRDHRRPAACTAGRAINKAERMGIRRARVVDANRRVVKVAGRKYNQRVMVTFANQRGCPILYR
ncbi:hypothetical protein [Aquamicrobium defluvii]|uniref:Antifreeze protein n=1 Tax=Aquamicrobium defluvii TaxID=69279 RepID=A0A011U5R9_9HYPH|nr:hypothetical protein [Aquamicrobium defluvii]EXL01426.1 hypothetical protein BG36_19530 [Aquamicrobium defluvii]EZQ12640.1 hypothetical protein CF98_35115 [Halopseudomonas bauzanensis]TDR30531.1 hypothetical protein DES43_1437 [Aquamicrobium defluvii]